jgi:hypothetical protein
MGSIYRYQRKCRATFDKTTKKVFDGSYYTSGGTFGRSIIEEHSNKNKGDQETWQVYAKMTSTSTTWQGNLVQKQDSRFGCKVLFYLVICLMVWVARAVHFNLAVSFFFWFRVVYGFLSCFWCFF